MSNHNGARQADICTERCDLTQKCHQKGQARTEIAQLWKAAQDAQANGDFDRLCALAIHQAQCAGRGAECKAFWRACEREASAARTIVRDYETGACPGVLAQLRAQGLDAWADALRGVVDWTELVY